MRPAQVPSRRPPSTRCWHTIFTDHDLLQRDLHTALLPDAPDLPAMPQGNPKHPIPPKQGKLLAHVTSLSTPPPQPDPVYPSAARPPKSQKYTTRFGVPDAMVMVKHKYRETGPGAKVKAREVICHGTHHCKSLARKMSRCVSVLWKYVTGHPTSVDVLAMHEIQHFESDPRTAAEAAQTRPHTQPRLWGELNVEENVPKHPQATHFRGDQALLVPHVSIKGRPGP